MTVIHNDVRYHDDDAKALGITAEKAQREPRADKAEKPTKTKGARRGVRGTADAGAPAAGES